MTEISLRPAVEGDAEDIHACIRAAYADAQRSISDLPDVAAGVDQDIRNRQVVVAERDGSIVGVVVYDRIKQSMMVFNLAVSPNAQGHGLARSLLDVVHNAAQDRRCTVLRLTTHHLMQGSRAMYRHLGWREVSSQGNKVFFEKPL